MTAPGLLGRFGLPPLAIERESLARIDRALDGRTFDSPAEAALAQRLVYASGDLQLADLLHCSPGALDAGVAALRRGALVVCDVRMVAAGLSAPLRRRLGCPMLCAAARPAAARARREG